MRLVSYLRPSKQAAAGEEAAAGRVSGLSACAAAGLSYFEQCPLSYARLCVDLCVQVSPQTRQIARKIFVDFAMLCWSASGDVQPGPKGARICFNSA